MSVRQNSGVPRARQAARPPKAFWEGSTEDVARALLGCRLVRRVAGLPDRTVVVVETEAYLGVADRAAHTWNGRRTPRVAPMWGPPGHAYVYRIYGIHDCLNVVTGEEGVPEAVLLRAAVPLAWWEGREVSRPELLSASGPGRLCRLLSIGRELSGAGLSGPDLELLRPTPGEARPVLSGPRVGVDYAGEASAWPLRFAVAGCPAVTRRSSLRSVP
ncbi:MAG: DNA-3-methyladenine glycosylase [Holophagales bacterium]|nr:DNA-3-methyladenine glycosylase [Holophagales bacterium]MBK9964253.1 DNA-3-methyladenine glycosylase [Holophagales bacterium]